MLKTLYSSINKVVLKVHPYKIKGKEVNYILNWLNKQDIETILLPQHSSELPADTDLLVVLGGDGTLLSGARMAAAKDIPLVGINFGVLGFLSEGRFKEATSILSKIFEGQYKIESRMMLNATIIRDSKKNNLPFQTNQTNRPIRPTDQSDQQTKFALNDMVITKGAFARLLRLKVYINEEYFAEYPGDGLIVATSTGSTAYSLSAGGPIISPHLDIIILTPICPHTLFARSTVISQKDTIKIIVPKNRTDTILTIDGQEEHPLLSSDVIVIKHSSCRVKFVRTKPLLFYETVRNKFNLVSRRRG